MKKPGPILLIDDDKDECELMQSILDEQQISNKLLCFHDGREAIDYLRVTEDQPFLIFCDINMPVMNGIELRKYINDDENLRRKSIPFIFYTTAASRAAVNEAYRMSVQGFFVKGHNIKQIGELVRTIYAYWQCCQHPNNILP